MNKELIKKFWNPAKGKNGWINRSYKSGAKQLGGWFPYHRHHYLVYTPDKDVLHILCTEKQLKKMIKTIESKFQKVEIQVEEDYGTPVCYRTGDMFSFYNH